MFDAFTVTEKLVFVGACPSLTVTVIVAVPVCPATGVTVTVRLAPLPPNVMFPVGTNTALFELPLTTKLPAAVSTSLAVN